MSKANDNLNSELIKLGIKQFVRVEFVNYIKNNKDSEIELDGFNKFIIEKFVKIAKDEMDIVIKRLGNIVKKK